MDVFQMLNGGPEKQASIGKWTSHADEVVSLQGHQFIWNFKLAMHSERAGLNQKLCTRLIEKDRKEEWAYWYSTQYLEMNLPIQVREQFAGRGLDETVKKRCQCEHTEDGPVWTKRYQWVTLYQPGMSVVPPNIQVAPK